ncbi:MAG: type II secretion system major pseudopilin GspG [Gammaproteobacteria bacterium]
MRTSKLKAAGFTLIEVMVVVVILGILASVVVVNVIGNIDKGNQTKAKADIRGLSTALNLYKLDNFNFPTTEQGLEALVSRPSSPPEPRNYKEDGYVQQVPLDPWGNPYQYLSPGESGPYDIYSIGRDGQAGGDDDVTFADLR